MTRKSTARHSGTSERVITPDSEFEILEAQKGVDVDVADTKTVIHALIDSKDADRSFITTQL